MTEATQSKYVRSTEGIAGYSPANHSGTSNQRLVSRDTVGAKYMELLIGTIVKFEGDDVAVLEIAQGVRVRVARSLISEVLGKDATAADTANDN